MSNNDKAIIEAIATHTTYSIHDLTTFFQNLYMWAASRGYVVFSHFDPLQAYIREVMEVDKPKLSKKYFITLNGKIAKTYYSDDDGLGYLFPMRSGVKLSEGFDSLQELKMHLLKVNNLAASRWEVGHTFIYVNQ